MAAWFSKKYRFVACLVASVIIITVAIMAWHYWQWQHFLKTPLIERQPYTYVFAPGKTLSNLAWDLHRAGYLAKPKELIRLAKRNKLATKLQAGQYQFDPGITPLQLLQKMARGEVVNHHITFIEGWTFKQMLTALKQNANVQHRLNDLSPAQVMRRLGHPGLAAEGLFYPDTYRFRYGMTDEQILKRAYATMQEKLLFAWQHRGANLPYQTPYQALIVASLIEKEATLVHERPIIAGVILNRLQRKMRLQIDPTVIYALGDNYNGHIRREDLRTQSPYNTYIHRGLPPTPIASPSNESIWAALHPLRTDYLYFVAKGDGSHKFSKTLTEQTQAINRYLRNKAKPKAGEVILGPVQQVSSFYQRFLPLCTWPEQVGIL